MPLVDHLVGQRMDPAALTAGRSNYPPLINHQLLSIAGILQLLNQVMSAKVPL